MSKQDNTYHMAITVAPTPVSIFEYRGIRFIRKLIVLLLLITLLVFLWYCYPNLSRYDANV